MHSEKLQNVSDNMVTSINYLFQFVSLQYIKHVTIRMLEVQQTNGSFVQKHYHHHHHHQYWTNQKYSCHYQTGRAFCVNVKKQKIIGSEV